MRGWWETDGIAMTDGPEIRFSTNSISREEQSERYGLALRTGIYRIRAIRRRRRPFRRLQPAALTALS